MSGIYLHLMKIQITGYKSLIIVHLLPYVFRLQGELLLMLKIVIQRSHLKTLGFMCRI